MYNKKHLLRTEYIHSNDMIPTLTPGVLYITDSPDLADELIRHDYPVAAHLHSGNKNCAFSNVRYLLEDPDVISDEDYEHIYNRICGLPCDILETKRVLVRETSIPDLEQLYVLYKDPDVTLYMEDLFEPEKEVEYMMNYIEKIYGLYDAGIWSLFSKDTGQLIGRMGVEYTEEDGTLEMGFMLGADYRHLGYATEAGLAIIEYARSLPCAERIRARVHRDNTASISLCRRLGFDYAGEDMFNSLTLWEMYL